MAAHRHTPFHAPWAVAGPHGYQLSGVGGTRNEEGSAPPMAPYSLRALWAQQLGATLLAMPPGEGRSVPQSLVTIIPPECSVPDWIPHLTVWRPGGEGLPASLPRSRAGSLGVGPT